MLKFIQFSEGYDSLKLIAELDKCMNMQWYDHFNKKDYYGAWQSISLRSASGKEQDIYSNYGVESYQDTALLAELPYLKAIIDSWQCKKESVRLLALHPGSEIKPHRDIGCNYKNGSFRIHIPILTNEHIQFTVGEEDLVMLPGSCWYVDFTEKHSIKNNGTTVRVHLIIDGLRNDWTDELFSRHGYDLNSDKTIEYDADTKLKMIAELEKMNTETSKMLINQLRGE